MSILTFVNAWLPARRTVPWLGRGRRTSDHVARQRLVFHGYALLFSNAHVSRYVGIRRWLEAAFALAFGAASLKVLTVRLQ